ncbi:virulence factor TspB C-terminal domain-related protein [Vibrio tarriae]|uniref:virulence factor TspB C-terminal domain-related protein n=1 Tax=Vibrio tarriae TaxID=2014742 RepID=UPI0011BFD9C8|nr:virulence factor TspB C-terminal domain-related protein [Vibrio tarriae]
MRIYTRIVIKLFFAFCFLFSASSFSAEWQVLSSHQLSDPYDDSSCLKAAEDQLKFWQQRYPDKIFSHGPVTPSQGSTCHGGFVTIYILQDLSCPSGSYPEYPSTDCKVTCNSDEILNPETNTCEPAGCKENEFAHALTGVCTPRVDCSTKEGEQATQPHGNRPDDGKGIGATRFYCDVNTMCEATTGYGTTEDANGQVGFGKFRQYTGYGCIGTPEAYTDSPYYGQVADDSHPEVPETNPDGSPIVDTPDSGIIPDPNPSPSEDFTPPNDSITPDPENPNLNKEGQDGVVNELNTANKSLENIQATLKATLTEHVSQNIDEDRYLSKLLVELKNSQVAGAANAAAIVAAIKGKPVGGGGGGNGDHVGDGEGECPEGEDCSGAVASFNCEAETFECKGDVIQCVTAEIQFKEHCLNAEFKQLETAFKKITTVDNVKAIVQDEQIDLSKIDTKYLNGSGLTVYGRCPPPYTFTVDIYKTVTVTIPLADLCAAVELFSPLIILFGWVSGIGLIGRQQGVF